MENEKNNYIRSLRDFLFKRLRIKNGKPDYGLIKKLVGGEEEIIGIEIRKCSIPSYLHSEEILYDLIRTYKDSTSSNNPTRNPNIGGPNPRGLKKDMIHIGKEEYSIQTEIENGFNGTIYLNFIKKGE